MATLTSAPTKTLTRTIHAPAEQLYKSFTEREWIRDWLCDDAFVRTAVGGHVALFWFPSRHAVGQFDALEANSHAALTLRFSGYAEDTHVEIFIAETGEVTLTLAGVVDSELEELWSEGLHRLQMNLETGADARITERVLIGIYPGVFNEEVAKKLNVPVTQGNLVTGVLPGLGAEKAGLKSDDVVVEVNGKTITDDMPIFLAVRGKKPGDVVDVAFYRDGEKQTTQMPLSGYPMPDFPADFVGLADQLAATFAELDKELTELFEGVSEEEAAKKPAEGEWSANEVLAHLILTERYNQMQIGSYIEAPELSGYAGNSDARINSVVETYQTNQALQAELRRSWAETVAVVRHFPAKLQERKSNLWWATFEFSGEPIHTRNHFTQIREAIEAARK